ncbi:hypothetical protein GCM10027456_48740 [Kineosporia babensis]
MVIAYSAVLAPASGTSRARAVILAHRAQAKENTLWAMFFARFRNRIRMTFPPVAGASGLVGRTRCDLRTDWRPMWSWVM